MSTLDGTNGFQINGEAERDRSGFSVASAGDVNGDGFGDLIVGAVNATPGDFSTSEAGAAYVIFGQATGPIRRSGTNGDDLLRGGAFDDALSGLRGDDRLFGNEGDDRLLGGAGLDRLSGGSGDDNLSGGDGSDRLAGVVGNDRLIGGLGADALTGGSGRDTFVFASVADSTPLGTDTISDFASGEDRLALNPIDADPDAAGNQAFAFRGASAFTGAGGEVRTKTANGDTLVLADTDGDRRADLQITLDGAVALTAADFIL